MKYANLILFMLSTFFESCGFCLLKQEMIKSVDKLIEIQEIDRSSGR